MLARFPSTGAVLAAAFFFVVVLVRTTLPLLDGDVWWHLRAGETILRDGSIPVADSWTIAGAGLQWVSQDWLSNVLIAALFGATGTWGATLLSLAFGTIAVVAFLLLWNAVRWRHSTASTLGRVFLLGSGLVVAAPVLGVRVQTVDLLMIAVTVGLLWGYVADRHVRWLAGLPVTAMVWANLHAGWPLLFALGGAVVAGEVADRILGRRVGRTPPLGLGEVAALSAALVASVPALLLNPNGWRLLTYPFTTAGIAAHRDFLFEWSPPDLTTFPGQALVGFLAIVVLPTLVLGHRNLRSADMLWLAGLSILSLTAVRFVIAIGPVGAAVAAVSLAPALAERFPSNGLALRFDRPPRSARIGFINLGLACVLAVAGLAAAAARVAPTAQEAAIREAMPVEATAVLAGERPSARIFNVYAWGGYVGRELPDSLVYIDGRSDIYGDGPIREYAEAITLERDPFELLDREAIDAVMFWPDTAFAAALDEHPDWTRVYEDGQAAIWLRGSDR